MLVATDPSARTLVATDPGAGTLVATDPSAGALVATDSGERPDAHRVADAEVHPVTGRDRDIRALPREFDDVDSIKPSEEAADPSDNESAVSEAEDASNKDAATEAAEDSSDQESALSEADDSGAAIRLTLSPGRRRQLQLAMGVAFATALAIVGSKFGGLTSDGENHDDDVDSQASTLVLGQDLEDQDMLSWFKLWRQPQTMMTCQPQLARSPG